MILEVLKHIFYPAPEYVKKMGYLREAIAIEARFSRCNHHWMPHLNKCKTIIMDAVKNLPENSHIMIVGTGALHDLPMGELLERNFKVSCVDIVHLPPVKKKYPEAKFITKDITEIAEHLYQVDKSTTFKPCSYSPEWVPEKKPDLVISLNILSQLPMTLMSYAKAADIQLPEVFEINIREAHIKWLKCVSKNNFLITDIRRNYFHRGELIQSDPALTDSDYELMGAPQEQWIWNIAPVGETEKEIGIEHQVGLWEFRD